MFLVIIWSILIHFISTVGNNNEQFYEAKLQLEDSRNNSTKVGPSHQAGNSNDSNIDANCDFKMPQIIQKGGNDFWMPAVNTKIKHSDNGVITTNTITSMREESMHEAQKNSMKILQNPIHINQKTTDSAASATGVQEFQDGTHALKSLLGLAAVQTSSNIAPSSPNAACKVSDLIFCLIVTKT